MTTPTTELEAVNSILATIGEQPVNSLSEGLTADVSLALTTLREVSRWVQTQGLWFNTETNYSFTLDTNSKAPVPPSIIRAEFSLADYPDNSFVIRDEFLYDTKNSTYVITKAPMATKVVFLLDWDYLPESVRQYILIRSSRLFSRRTTPDDKVEQYSAMDELDARRRVMREGGTVLDLNVLRGPGVRNILNRRA